MADELEQYFLSQKEVDVFGEFWNDLPKTLDQANFQDFNEPSLNDVDESEADDGSNPIDRSIKKCFCYSNMQTNAQVLSYFSAFHFLKRPFEGKEGKQKVFALYPHCQVKLNTRKVTPAKISSADRTGLLDLFSGIDAKKKSFSKFDQEGHVVFTDNISSHGKKDLPEDVVYVATMLDPVISTFQKQKPSKSDFLGEPVARFPDLDNLKSFFHLLTVCHCCLSCLFFFLISDSSFPLLLQKKEFDTCYKFSANTISQHSRVLAAIRAIVDDVLVDHFGSIASFPKMIELYYILLDHRLRLAYGNDIDYGKMFNFRAFKLQAKHMPPQARQNSMTPDELKAATENVQQSKNDIYKKQFMLNWLVPASPEELCTRLHFLIKASLPTRVNFIDGQKRTAGAILNSIGLQLSFDGYDSFALAPDEKRLLCAREIPEQTSMNILINDLGSYYYRTASSPVGYRFYIQDGSSGYFKESEVTPLKEKSRMNVDQSSKSEDRSFKDIFLEILDDLKTNHVHELCPYVHEILNPEEEDSDPESPPPPKKQKHSVRFVEKDFVRYKKHICHLLYQKIVDKGGNATQDLINSFTAYVNTLCATESTKASILPSPPPEESDDEADDTRNKPGHQWYDIDTYPPIEHEPQYYFSKEDVENRTDDFKRYVGFHDSYSSIKKSSFDLARLAPLEWQVLIEFVVLAVSGTLSAERAHGLIRNDGNREDKNFPDFGFVYNVNKSGDSIPYRPLVSSSENET